jgi:hypothetical protein
MSENETRISQRINNDKSKIREEIEAMREGMLLEMETIIDARAHMVVGSLFGTTSKQHVLLNNSHHLAGGGGSVRSQYSSQMGLLPTP